MARSKINPEETDVSLDEEKKTNTALAAQSTEVGDVSEEYNPDYYDDVDRDTDVPFIALVSNSGNLAKQFRNQAGNFVYNDKIVGPELDVVPVAVLKYFIERARDGEEIKYGSPLWKLRKTFETAREAAQQGYVIDFKNKAPNRIEEAARIGYLVVGHDGAEPEDFPLSAGGFRFALGKASYHRGGYRHTFQPVFDHAVRRAAVMGISKKGLTHAQLFNAAKAWDGVWTLRSKEEVKMENAWFEPHISKKVKLPPEVFDWITEEYGNIRA